VKRKDMVTWLIPITKQSAREDEKWKEKRVLCLGLIRLNMEISNNNNVCGVKQGGSACSVWCGVEVLCFSYDGFYFDAEDGFKNEIHKYFF
jgi:hypothetical protein